MNDARLGIVRLPLPDGREVALQLTFARLDAVGHVGIMELFSTLSKGKVGSAHARARLLEVFSDGAVTEADIAAAPSTQFPISESIRALWAAWELAQYGPDGRPATDGAPNPPRRPLPTWWRTACARLFGRG